MVTKSWMYDGIIYIYALSLLFYFSDFVGSNRKAKRMGAGLLIFVWILQTIYLLLNLYFHRVTQVFTMFETLFLFSWVLVTLSLVVNRFFRIELFVFFVNVVGFAILALNFFSSPNVVPTLNQWGLSDELLFIHISLAICSYAAFSISAVFSVMYLFLHHQLKEKHWSATMKRLPSLDTIDRYAYWAVMTGAPLLTLALALGLVWIVLQGDLKLLLDLKVVNSMFIIGAYALYLLLRLSLRIAGKRLAWWNLAAFCIVIINFILSNLFSGFHQWIWK